MRVPTTPSTVAIALSAMPSPAESWHTTEVPDAHDAVPQLLAPTAADGVVSVSPLKLTPLTVTLTPPVSAALSLERKLTTGAAHRVSNDGR